MDIEFVNDLHRKMKAAEAEWLNAWKLSGDTHHPVIWDNDADKKYRAYRRAQRDYEDAANEMTEQIDAEVEQRR
jgi:hypothetical protein